MLYVIKALHIIFAVTWFAALFYIPRLFIYQTEARDRNDDFSNVLINQFKLMSLRLWKGIAWPSLILNLLFGIGILHPHFSNMPTWLIVKLALIVMLIGYHFLLHIIYKGLQKDVYTYSSQQLRAINEIATLFLFTIVLLGVMKWMINWIYFGLGMVILLVLLYVGIVVYKRKRKDNQ
jgi:putative membrane protein